ncbi:MAG: hypothetical protein ABI844_02230 [Saprospiraceae bacterium]
MYRLLVFIFFIYTIPLSSQIGVQAVTTFPKTRIAETNTNNRLFPFLVGAGADYWFRLKKYRLEFFPAIHYQAAFEKITFNDNTSGKLNWTVLDFTPVFQFYPLDFNNDCMCPTFSKQGQFLKKGFFLQLAPGIAYSRLSGEQTIVKNVSESIAFLRLGAGIDIGVSDLITLSPVVNYQLSQTLDWSRFFTTVTSSKVDVFSGLFFSLRMGWRFDRKNY